MIHVTIVTEALHQPHQGQAKEDAEGGGGEGQSAKKTGDGEKGS